uniref:Uncharacterized protein n=1 Tax=Tanacetum cinerariifolium TaxID=118510 RepID=A0A6L2J434_TANCI|nr:hypothetical protein [Tanacetum cinerariifolium]
MNRFPNKKGSNFRYQSPQQLQEVVLEEVVTERTKELLMQTTSPCSKMLIQCRTTSQFRGAAFHYGTPIG